MTARSCPAVWTARGGWRWETCWCRGWTRYGTARGRGPSGRASTGAGPARRCAAGAGSRGGSIGRGSYAPAGAGNFLLMPSAGYFLSRKKGVFRAPARVTFGHSPKSDQKGCLKPKVSRLPARYALLLLVVFTARSREFDFVVRTKGSSLRLRRCR